MKIMRTIPYVALCLLAGCLARPHLDKQTFIFSPPGATTPKSASSNHILGIRTLQVTEPFDGRSFVYRAGEYSYDRDPYAEFMVHPAEALISPIETWFRQSGGFSTVVETGSALKPDTLVEIQVLQLYGDFRPSEPPAAVMAMRFVFFSEISSPGKPVLQQEYTQRIPLKARTAAALIEGWNQALSQILDSATQDFGRIDTTAPKL